MLLRKPYADNKSPDCTSPGYSIHGRKVQVDYLGSPRSHPEKKTKTRFTTRFDKGAADDPSGP